MSLLPPRLLLVLFVALLNRPLAAQAPVAPPPSGAINSPLRELEARAATGDAVAARRLAESYQSGAAGARDLAAAARYYEIAAKRGDAEAQYNLANMFLLGEGVAEDRNAALNYYRLAAEQGHQLASRNLGEMLRIGETNRGGPALDADAQAALALAQRHGIIVRFEAGETPVLSSVERPAVIPATPAPVPESSAPPTTKVPIAIVPAATKSDGIANQPLVQAQEALAARDFSRAVTLLEGLARKGEAEAQFRLAQLYDWGTGVAPDLAQAVTWYRAAARLNHPGALARLQEIYRSEGLPMPSLAPGTGGSAPR